MKKNPAQSIRILNPVDTRPLTVKERLQVYVRHHRNPSLKFTLALVCCLGLLLTLFPWQVFSRPAAAVPPDATNRAVQLTYLGDIALGDAVELQAGQTGFDALFSAVAPLWQDSAYVLGNLDSTSPTGAVQIESYYALEAAGIRLVSLANARALERGETALATWARRLGVVGVKPLGVAETAEEAVQPYVITQGGYSIATIAVTDIYSGSGGEGAMLATTATRTYGYYLEAVAAAARQNDYVVVYVNWGREYTEGVTDRQSAIAHALVDAGASLVVGSHPHLVQPVEFYRRGAIVYSLGNFVADHAWSRTKDSVLLNFVVEHDGASYLEFYPLRIEKAAPAPAGSAFHVKRTFAGLTKGLAPEQYTEENGVLRVHLT